MKPRSLQLLPRTLVVCFAPLLVCGSASASVLDFNEANTTNVWTLPAGTNLLTMAGTVVTPASPATHESSSGSWATLTDGILGAPGNNTAVVTPNNNDTVTYALNVVAQPAGYDLTTFDSYATWGDSGRDNQNYTLQYSSVSDPGTFINIFTVNNSDSATDKSTHTSLTDTTGVLATGVHSLRVVFGNPQGQENGYVGMSEFRATAVPTNVLTTLESNTTNSWTLPAGTNLLNGATANPLTTDVHEGSSPNWTTVTNGLLGASNEFSASVTPNNNKSVIFPLNLAVNFNGYNISSIDTYCAWVNSGRDNQNMAISYSTVAAPATFIPLGNAVLRTGGDSATHIRLDPASGFLATGVAAIKFDTGHQENGYVGLREFIALGTAVSISDPLTWTGGSGSGGNATWTTAPDSNWKKTVGGATSPFNSLAALTFDNTGANTNINVSAPLSASAMTFTSGAYTFGGGLVTVSNDIVSSGASGSATFNNAMKAGTGVTLTGSGSLVFNGALESTGLVLAGPGGITLNAANPALTGSVAVSDGTLTVSHNNGLQGAGLAMTGGTALFTTAAPLVSSITSSIVTPGTIFLGHTSGPTVNTTLTVGDAASITTFGGSIFQASGTVGSLTKTGASTLVLSGENIYSGVTTVNGGTLQFDQPLSLYDGATASWTAGNLVVGSSATLAFKVGGPGEFTETNIDTDLSLGGFASGSFLGLNCSGVTTLTRNLTRPGLGLVKSGPAILNLTGSNTSNGTVKVFAGALNAAGSGSPAINGNVVMGDASTDIVLNLGGDNQLAPTSLITFTNGNFYGSKINLRGTNQTIAGLDSAPFPANKVSLIQNDEIGQPGYAGVPIAASLTINATTDHSFYGLIRDQTGGPVSVTKTGPGTQEFVNMGPIQGFGYTGDTLVQQGKLRLNFVRANSSYNSNIAISAPATFNLHSAVDGYDFNPVISGAGKLLVTGGMPVALTNGSNSWTGGTTVDGGFFALKATNANGQGDGPNQTCVGGAMDPSNLINLINGGILSLDNAGALGNSPVQAQYAPSIHVNEGCKIFGGTNTIAFLCNITLDGGKIEITNGASVAGFNTNLCLVGTDASPLIVGGVSTVPAEIHTTGTGPNANVSLGSMGTGMQGTVFQVADVAVGVDLTVSSALTNINVLTSTLKKTGPGTMLLSGANTYTGATTVTGGELTVSGNSIADSGKLVLNGGKLGIVAAADEVVDTLYYGGVQQDSGTYGSTLSGAAHQDDSRFSGTGILTVTTGLVVTYDQWASVITNGLNARGQDADGDGLKNLDEFLFGTSPIAANGSLTTTEKSGATLIIRWSERLNSSSSYVLLESTDLSAWTTSLVVPTVAGDQSGLYSASYVRKQAVIPIDSAKKFNRVFATE
jgi:autotransporter-associated beta strand protein